MKRSEMNKHQKEAFDTVKEEYGWIVGGFENTMLDYAEDSEEWKAAANALAHHDALAEMIYEAVMDQPNASTKRALRFAGTEFIKERIERRLQKDGY